ncbi:MAG TPA: hypothetical protein VMH89_15800 [Candidatus Acidoferrum sp.]|nr:hypothetical protein [Candidatus Acidoferrum sp.]
MDSERSGHNLLFRDGWLADLVACFRCGRNTKALTGVAGPAIKPSISRGESQLVYQQPNKNDNIWRIDLKDEKHATGPPVPAFSSRGFIYRPSFSPDGKKVAFESDRLGYADIWVCNQDDDSNCAQITNLHAVSGTARWSPSGQWLAFEAVQKHFWQLYVSEMPGGQGKAQEPSFQSRILR